MGSIIYYLTKTRKATVYIEVYKELGVKMNLKRETYQIRLKAMS